MNPVNLHAHPVTPRHQSGRYGLYLSLLAILTLLLPPAGNGQSNQLQQHYSRAMQAQQSGDYRLFYEEILKAHEIHPQHQGILYQAGLAAALNNKPDEAITYLKSAVLIQSDFSLDIPELKTLRGMPAFEAIRKIKEAAAVPIITSDTAVLITDRTLHLEGIAAGPSPDEFFAGSIRKRKIVRLKDGVVTDFTRAGEHGLCAVMGIRVDARRQRLWVSSSPMPQMENFREDLPSGVFLFDLTNGQLIAKFLPENPRMALVLGDLAINARGEVFVSDSRNNLIFKVNEASGKLEQVFSSDDFRNLQGITFADDDRFLFIADYVKGLYRLEMKTFRLTPLDVLFELSLKGVDGLAFDKHSLIAIQNGIQPMRVTRYALNADRSALTSFEILERGHPAFGEPTQGTVAGNHFYYIANSQYDGYDQNGGQKPAAELKDIVVLGIKLR